MSCSGKRQICKLRFTRSAGRGLLCGFRPFFLVTAHGVEFRLCQVLALQVLHEGGLFLSRPLALPFQFLLSLPLLLPFPFLLLPLSFPLPFPLSLLFPLAVRFPFFFSFPLSFSLPFSLPLPELLIHLKSGGEKKKTFKLFEQCVVSYLVLVSNVWKNTLLLHPMYQPPTSLLASCVSTLQSHILMQWYPLTTKNPMKILEVGIAYRRSFSKQYRLGFLS